MILQIRHAVTIKALRGNEEIIAVNHLGHWLREFLKTTADLTETVPMFSEHAVPATWQDALKAEIWQKIEPYLNITVEPKDFEKWEKQLKEEGKPPSYRWTRLLPDGIDAENYVYDEDEGYRAKTRADVEKEKWGATYTIIPKKIIEWTICPHHDNLSKKPHLNFLGGPPDEAPMNKMQDVLYKRILRKQLGEKFKTIKVDRIQTLRKKEDDYGNSLGMAIKCAFSGRKIGEETRRLKFPKSWFDHFLASLKDGTPYETIEIEQRASIARACPHI